MMFTSQERQLLHLYLVGSVDETAAVLRDALNDITERDERAAAESVLRKLEGISGSEFGSFSSTESMVCA